MTATRRRSNPLVALPALLLVVVFVSTMTTVIVTIAIWPGEAALTAPLFCPDDQPDGFVVSDTYHPAPGETVTNFTLYCVGPRGDTTEVGFGKPFLALSVAHGLLWFVVLVLAPILGGVGRLRRRRRRSDLDQATIDELARSMGRAVDGRRTQDDLSWPQQDEPS